MTKQKCLNVSDIEWNKKTCNAEFSLSNKNTDRNTFYIDGSRVVGLVIPSK